MKFNYDEISPITGNKCVLVEVDANNNQHKMCMESGYTCNSQHHFKNDEDMAAIIEDKMPDFIVQSKVIDDLGFHWYLAHITTPYGSLYPIPSSDTEYSWVVNPVIDGQLRMDSIVKYESNQFEDALDGLTQLLNQERNKEEEE